jgi:hypothetical protein
MRQALEVNDSLAHLETRDILVQVRAAFPLTEADIRTMINSLSLPFKSTDNIRAFVNNQRNMLVRLTNAGHPLPQILAIEELSKAFKSNGVDKEDFFPMFSEFRVAHGALAQQTVANFTAFVITFVEQRLPHHRAANAARRQANAAEIIPPPHPAPVAAAAIAAPQQYQHQHQAAGGRGAANGRGGGGRAGGQGGRGGRNPAGHAPAGQPRAYCHTHGGPAPGERGHYSVACRNAGPNHNWLATFDNQMGGKLAV